MALKKEIKMNNGIILTYHRIVSLNKITNNSSIIEVASYLKEEERQKEIIYFESEDPDKKCDVIIVTEYIAKEYNEDETIKDAYDYLKTIEMFEGAENA